jgi:hypothetical protein
MYLFHVSPFDFTDGLSLQLQIEHSKADSVDWLGQRDWVGEDMQDWWMGCLVYPLGPSFGVQLPFAGKLLIAFSRVSNLASDPS